MTQSASDLRYCGVCWQGKAGVRLHYCDEKLGHEGDHRCHCGARLAKPGDDGWRLGVGYIGAEKRRKQ